MKCKLYCRSRALAMPTSARLGASAAGVGWLGNAGLPGSGRAHQEEQLFSVGTKES